MKEKNCYVMMPYGSGNEELERRFMGIYESIIKPAARACGFDDAHILRQDHTGEPGVITNRIITNIASADILIADLTGANPNVYYELGISHVFHKCATVLIVDRDSEQKIKFDLSGLSYVKYSTNLGDLQASISSIVEAIKVRQSGSAATDSPVHEVIGSLPVRLMDLLDGTSTEAEVQRSAKLEKEVSRLRSLCRDHGINPEDVGKSYMSPVERIAMQRKALPYSGKIALDKIRQYAEAEDDEGLLDYFSDIFENHGLLSDSEAQEILRICDGRNIVVKSIVTEVIASLFPNDPNYQTRLAKVLAVQPERRGEAIDVVNAAIGLVRDDEGHYAYVDDRKLTHNNLARFFDTYIQIEMFDELVSAGDFLLSHAPVEREMIIRNIFYALSMSHRFDEANRLLPEVEASGNDVALYKIGFHFDRMGDRVKAYEYWEKAMVFNPIDMDYPRTLAGHILDEKIARCGGEIQSVSKDDSRRIALSFLLYIVEMCVREGDLSDVKKVLQILSRKFNGLTQYQKVVVSYVNGEIDRLPYEDSDTRALDYVKALMEKA
ncbi:MAG: hypothetical protein IKO83_11330 [Oscillospiraceae bacterium]|nr:hypothetical protein [Oscillospiraceae bacterium]